MSNKVYVTWEDIEHFVDYTADILSKSDIDVPGIYGLPRGGLIFAVMLSHRLNKPMLISPCEGCLIVDDICDSGESLIHYTKNTSSTNKPKYITATMYYKENKLNIVPDY